MKKILYFTLVCLFSFCNIIAIQPKTPVKMVEQKMHYAPSGKSELKVKELEEYYSTNTILIAFSYLADTAFTIDYSLDNCQLLDLTDNFDKTIKVEFEIFAFSNDASFELFLRMGDSKLSADIYFEKTLDNLFITSSMSKSDAQKKKLKHEFDLGLISEDYFYEKRKEIMNKGVIIDNSPSFMPMAVTPTTIRMAGILFWMDDNYRSHQLNYTKIEAFERVWPTGLNISMNISLGVFYTDSNGSFNFNFTDLYAGTAHKVGYYLRVYAAGENTTVLDAGEMEYYYESDISFNVQNGSTIYYYRTFLSTEDLGQAFQISQAAIYSAKYIAYLNKGQNIKPVTIYYSSLWDSCGYTTTGEIYIDKVINGSDEYPNSYASWDVVSHEYGHHVQRIFETSLSVGGEHEGGINLSDYYLTQPNYYYNNARDAGINTAWGEGWATFFSISMQKHFIYELSNIDFVGDSFYTSYNEVNYDLNDYIYPGNTYALGEADEAVISQFLYHLLSDNEFIYTDLQLWDIINKKQPDSGYKVHNLYGLVHNLTNYVDVSIDIFAIGKLLSKLCVAPTKVAIIGGGYSLDTPPTFSWDASGGSENFPNDLFAIEIRGSNRQKMFETTVLRKTDYALTAEEWKNINDAPGSNYYVSIISKVTKYGDSTGPYYSEFFMFSKPRGVSETIDIGDYGYPDAYPSDYDTMTNFKNHTTSSGFMFRTRRQRTGYIQKEYIVMSPMRFGEGKAFLEYQFAIPINAIEVDLTFWSGVESLSYTNGEARIEQQDESGNWYQKFDLLYDIVLSTNRNFPRTYLIIFDNPVYGFRFYSTGPTDFAGSDKNNRGRICIGKMTLFS